MCPMDRRGDVGDVVPSCVITTPPKHVGVRLVPHAGLCHRVQHLGNEPAVILNQVGSSIHHQCKLLDDVAAFRHKLDSPLLVIVLLGPARTSSWSSSSLGRASLLFTHLQTISPHYEVAQLSTRGGAENAGRSAPARSSRIRGGDECQVIAAIR